MRPKRRISMPKSGYKGTYIVSAARAEVLRRMSEANKGRSRSEATRRKISQSHTGMINSEETRRKLSLNHSGGIAKGTFQPIGHGLHVAQARRGKSLSQWDKDSKSISHKRLWQDPEYAQKTIKRLMQSTNTRPTRPELIVYKLIEYVCPGEYEYSGDGTYIIDRMNPDFFNINGQKKVIEMFGDYWHRGEDPQVKIGRYAQSGFDCLVIWERELENSNNVITKIRNFNNKAHGEMAKENIIANQQLRMF